MRHRVTLIGATILAIILLIPASASAIELSVTDLLAEPDRYSGVGVEVVLEGELIGDYGARRDGWMWTQLNDDTYARYPLVDGGPKTGANVGVAVRIPAELAAGLDPPGGYRLRGPLVRVAGTWKYHDPARGGESYLEVAALEVVQPGRRIEESLDVVVLSVALVLMAVAVGLWVARPRDE